MNKTILILFVSIIAVTLTKSDNNLKLFSRDLIYQLQHLDENKKDHHNLKNNYLVIIKIRGKDDGHIKGEDFKPIARLNYDVETKKKQVKENLILSQHKARMKEVTDFMEDHMMTTKYLYEEVRRIKRDRQIKDKLREMVAYLERPENKEEKAAVLKCFIKNKKVLSKKKKNVWDQKANDLVINVIKDHFNDGTID